MKGQERTWSEWFYEKAITTLSFAMGLAGAGLIDYYLGISITVLASVVTLAIGVVFAALAIYLKDNHNQVK